MGPSTKGEDILTIVDAFTTQAGRSGTQAAAGAGAGRARYRSSTILGHGRAMSTDSFETGLNNNLLVIGPSGSGKTRGVLKPNLLEMGSSFIVLDTKGMLCREVGPILDGAGYRVGYLDFTDLSGEGRPMPGCAQRMGYNPLAFIRTVERDGKRRPNQQDILSVARALCPVESVKDPFWDYAASNLLACLIAYVMEELPEGERHFGSVIALTEHLGDNVAFKLLGDLEMTDPESMACSMYQRYRSLLETDRTNASIIGILSEKLMCLGFDGAIDLYTAPRRVDFAELAERPRALFVTVSDIDRTIDPLTSLFVDQAIKELVRAADRTGDGRLTVPVRFMLDDFANLRIENIDSVLSISRSREIWFTLLLQSVNQLDAIYGHPRALSIMSNCDTQLVLGFQDIETARAFNERADRLPSNLLRMPRSRAMLFVAGERGEEIEKYRLEEHPRYRECVALSERAMRDAEQRWAAERAANAALTGAREGGGKPFEVDELDLEFDEGDFPF